MSDDRRSRLKALAARAGRTKPTTPEGEKSQEAPRSSDPKKPLTFRNYAPTNKSLEQIGKTNEVDNDAAPPDARRSKRPRNDDETGGSTTTTLAPTFKSMLQDALKEAQKDVNASTNRLTPDTGGAALDVSIIAPSKANWDLKRDIQPKLNKLEKRTQKAIVDMLKERLELEAAQAADDDFDNEDGDNLD